MLGTGRKQEVHRCKGRTTGQVPPDEGNVKSDLLHHCIISLLVLVKVRKLGALFENCNNGKRTRSFKHRAVDIVPSYHCYFV